MSKPELTNMSLRVAKPWARKVKIWAVRHDMSVADVIRQAVNAYMAGELAEAEESPAVPDAYMSAPVGEVSYPPTQ
ncbi:MAG: hypothetical protein KGL39_04105 [Patescibacteria group bacterium]|nr:hypothetical protein [Patescibacteria group bacterium]